MASKNGGPVDIMTTLHHGLLVDPNSSKEIADALVKILTEPKEWEEMSQNGIKNIMAYSWPSHCKQVLESLEKEKQYHKTHTVSLLLLPQFLCPLCWLQAKGKLAALTTPPPPPPLPSSLPCLFSVLGWKPKGSSTKASNSMPRVTVACAFLWQG